MRIHRLMIRRVKMKARSPVAPSWLALVGVLGLAACERERIDEQRVPKGVEQVVTAGTPADATAPASNTAAASQAPAREGEAPGPWVVSESWTLSPDSSPMRVATYIATVEGRPIQIAITRFEGQVGGVLANVNRWRGQMGLAEIAEGDLDTTLTRFGPPEWPGYTLRVAGESQHMLAAGVYEQAQDRTWFARASASPRDLDAIDPEFQAFVRSIGGSPAP